jgi:hypothetical protein
VYKNYLKAFIAGLQCQDIDLGCLTTEEDSVAAALGAVDGAAAHAVLSGSAEVGSYAAAETETQSDSARQDIDLRTRAEVNTEIQRLIAGEQS